MNAATILIALALAVLLFVIIRYMLRHGTCDTCEMKGQCGHASKGSAGKCAACPYSEQEQRLREAARKAGMRNGR